MKTYYFEETCSLNFTFRELYQTKTKDKDTENSSTTIDSNYSDGKIECPQEQLQGSTNFYQDSKLIQTNRKLCHWPQEHQIT